MLYMTNRLQTFLANEIATSSHVTTCFPFAGYVEISHGGMHSAFMSVLAFFRCMEGMMIPTPRNDGQWSCCL